MTSAPLEPRGCHTKKDSPMTPTPTAEERAKNALEFIGWGCGADVCEHLDCPSCGCMAYLAQAIREAEDAAYERAAAKFDDFADHAEQVGLVAAKSRTGRDKARAAARAYREASCAARALKSPKEV